MNLLIDAHILIWYIAGNPSLPKAMTDLLEDAENEIHISIASLWEISIKVGKGKLDLGIEFHELEAILNQLNIQILPILFGDLNVHRTLPFHHNDPFDRLIIAQSIHQDLMLMSADSAFNNYPIQNVWSGLQ
jgi:PIN domain nuclease of toxin-antitoxin system